MRVAAAALTGGSLVVVALSYAVGLLAFAEAGGNPDAARNLVRTIGIDAPQRSTRFVVNSRVQYARSATDAITRSTATGALAPCSGLVSVSC